MVVARCLGIHLAGGAWVPFDLGYPPDRLRYMLEDSGVALVLTSAASARALPAASAPSLAIEEAMTSSATSSDHSRWPPRSERSASYVIYTSGSTGKPKGVVVDDRGMLNHLDAKIDVFGITEADVVAQTASHCFDISVWQSLVALVVGGRTHVVPDNRADPEDLLGELDRAGVTISKPSPSLLQVVVDGLSERHRLSSLRWVIPTGEALPLGLAAAWGALRPGIPLVNAYGPTECSDDVTHYVVPAVPLGPRMPIGRPIRRDVSVRRRRRGSSRPNRGIGRAVRRRKLARGYHGRAELTGDRFVPAPYGEPGSRMYRTGDVVRWNASGELEYLGRLGTG